MQDRKQRYCLYSLPFCGATSSAHISPATNVYYSSASLAVLRFSTITLSKRFTRKVIGKICRSVRAYIYLAITSQVQARSSIVSNSAPAVDSQQVFKSTLKALINEDYSIGIDIDRCRG